MNEIERMEKIRELLVGEQLHQIDQTFNEVNHRFDKSQTTLKQTQGELQDEIENLRKELTHLIEKNTSSLKEEMKIALTELHHNKTDREELAHYFEVIAKSLRSNENTKPEFLS